MHVSPAFLSSFSPLLDTSVIDLDLPADIVFDYRQKATRSFEYLQGDYYIAPYFMVIILFC